VRTTIARGPSAFDTRLAQPPYDGADRAEGTSPFNAPSIPIP
jgi:hypothetical protein